MQQIREDIEIKLGFDEKKSRLAVVCTLNCLKTKSHCHYWTAFPLDLKEMKRKGEIAFRPFSHAKEKWPKS